MWNIGDPLENELLVAAFLRDNFPIAIGGKRGTVVQGCNYPARKKKHLLFSKNNLSVEMISALIIGPKIGYVLAKFGSNQAYQNHNIDSYISIIVDHCFEYY